MNADERRHVIAQLDVLSKEVAGTIQRFEAAGVTSIMKDDYVALHVLEHRIMQMRLEQVQAIEAH